MQPDARRVRERELRRKEQIKGEGRGGGLRLVWGRVQRVFSHTQSGHPWVP